ILPYMLAAISKVTGWTNIVPRLLIISFSTLGTIAMLIISRRLFSRPVALASTFLFSVLPLTVYYGQAFMPDFPSISLMLSSIAFLIIRDKYKNYYRLFMILSLVALILGVLIKLQHVFFVPVVFFFLINKRIEFKLPFKAKEFLQEVMAKDILKKFVFFILGPVIIVLGYYVFDYKIDPSYKYPHGNLIDPLLFLRGTNRNGINFYEMSLGYIHYVAISIIGFLLFIIGISSKLKGDIKLKKITNAFIYIWIITIVAFYVVFSGGAIINLYYMIFALPILVLGIGYFFELLKKNNLFYIVPIFIIIVVSGTSDYTRGWLFNLTERFDAVVLGNLIQENTNDDESIIVVDYVTYEPTNLYHTNRKGWVVGEGELSIINIEEYKKKGAAGVGISARFIAGIRNNEELYGYLFTLRNVSYQDNYFFFL
ncbi:MAG TPA: glycosyltransferase family 39 protein, partial [Candidatus Dojkabacteria bacterium]